MLGVMCHVFVFQFVEIREKTQCGSVRETISLIVAGPIKMLGQYTSEIVKSYRSVRWVSQSVRLSGSIKVKCMLGR